MLFIMPLWYVMMRTEIFMWQMLYITAGEHSWVRNGFLNLTQKGSMWMSSLSRPMRRQMRLFNDHFADRLANSELLEVYHAGRTYGGTPLYTPGVIEGLFFKRNWGMPMIVSKFKDKNGKDFLLFVNNSQNKIERIEGEYKGKKIFMWFAPGQMQIVEED